MDVHGKVWNYGDNLDTDVIIPGRYCNISAPAELANYALADLAPAFVTKPYVQQKLAERRINQD